MVATRTYFLHAAACPAALALVVGACSADSGPSAGSDDDASMPDAATETSVTDAAVDSPTVDAAGDAGSDAGDPLAACEGGTSGLGSDAATTQLVGFGSIELDSPASIQILELTTTLIVPTKPPASGTVFLWPGLQPLPGGASYLPIDNGVLQPVLTWGPTCAPNAPASSYASWWVSAQYVNTVGKAPGFTGCQGGTGMTVSESDALLMTMTLSGSTWSQKVTDLRTGQAVHYDIDLGGQGQARALFVIEGYSQQPTIPVQFQSTVVTFASPPGSCQPLRRGMTDEFSPPITSPDGTHCCFATMTLRPEGL